MNEFYNYDCCNNNSILEKLTKDNFEKVICDNRCNVLYRKHLTLYHVTCTGKMRSKDNLWIECVSYNPIYDHNTHYTRDINSFIKNFIPIILTDFEKRLIDETHYLTEKINELNHLIHKNPKFKELLEDDKILIKKQYNTMYIYLNCLETRVNKMLKQKIEEYDKL